MFKCKSCGRTDSLEEVMVWATVSTPLRISKSGEVIYGPTTTIHGEVDHYQCSSCGADIRDEDGNLITESLDLIELVTGGK